MIKAVLFDLDGTLVNSLEDLAASTNYALAKFGFPAHETEKFKYFVGDGMPKLIERVLPENSRDVETHKEVLKIFMNHYRLHYADKTTVYDGINEVLQELKSQNLKIAVISNKAQEMASVVVKKLLGCEFDIVCGKRAEYPAKPDPALTLKLIGELGVKPKECVIVGDSAMDCKTAVNAGCISIGVLWGFRTKAELLENKANYIAEKPYDIIDIIKEINKR